MSECQEFKDAMQELINANIARVEALGNHDAYYAAIQRQVKAEEKAIELLDRELA